MRVRRGQGGQKIFVEIMAKNFTNFMKTINSQIQEAQQTLKWKHEENYTKKHYNYIP